jgi:molybdopterin-binding protein
MDTLTAAEAADLLRLDVRRVQVLARTGKLPGVRVGRKWLFHRAEIERLIGRSAQRPRPAAAEMLSARNHLRGEIVSLRSDGLMAEIVVRIGDQDLVAVITRSSAERLELAVGDHVAAVMKATEVMIAKGPGA